MEDFCLLVVKAGQLSAPSAVLGVYVWKCLHGYDR